MSHLAFVNCDTNCTTGAIPINSIGATDNCTCLTAKGNINDYFFTPCSEIPTDAELVDVAWWQGLVTDGKLSRFGVKGIGGWSQTNIVRKNLGGCSGIEEITRIDWTATWKQYCHDQSDAQATNAFFNSLRKYIGKYNVWIRPCFNTDKLLFVGEADITDFQNTLPEDTGELMEYMVSITWSSLDMPTFVNIPGLSLVIPPAK